MGSFTMKSDAASPSTTPTTNISAAMDNTHPKANSILRRFRRKLSPKTKSNSQHTTRSNNCGSSNSSAGAISDDIHLVFDFFDKNGDGKISAQELQSCITTVGGNLSLDEAEAAIKSSDLDGDGMMGFHDFQKLMEDGDSNEEERNKEIMEAFGMYVIEGSEGITPASLRRMLSRLGESKSINDCKAMIRVFDLNGDGVLSFDEFTIMMQ